MAEPALQLFDELKEKRSLFLQVCVGGVLQTSPHVFTPLFDANNLETYLELNSGR